jgi:hypothetical protein
VQVGFARHNDIVRPDLNHQETRMKRLVFTALAALLMSNVTMAAESCDAQAAAKKLSGAAKTSFTKKCEAEGRGSAASTCTDQAASKKLAGAAKTSFMKKCEADATAAGSAAGPMAACESQAKDKKLAGAAKNSFVKKCVTDAKG